MVIVAVAVVLVVAVAVPTAVVTVGSGGSDAWVVGGGGYAIHPVFRFPLNFGN